MFDSVRSRLTLWYVAVLATVLVVFGVSVYALLARDFYERMDDDLRASVEGTGASMLRMIAGGEAEAEAASDALEEHIGPREAAAVFDPGGNLVAENPALGDIHARLPAPDAPAGETVLYTDPGSGRRVGVRRINVDPSGKSYLIVISRSFNLVTRELRSIRLTLYLAVSVALALAALGGWFLARRSLAPVAEPSSMPTVTAHEATAPATPRRPGAACSARKMKAVVHSPPTDRPWIMRRSVSRIGAASPSVA